MGQLHFQQMSLEELVSRSSVIVVAQAAARPTRDKRVKVAKGPPFVTPIWRFRVLEVLRNLSSKKLTGVLEVHAHDWQVSLRLHRDYHATGLSRHVMRDTYRLSGEGPDLRTESVILF